MKKSHIFFLFLIWTGLCKAQEFRLAPPQVHSSSDFFDKNTSISMDFALEGAQIWYSLDRGAHWKLYKKPVLCKKSTVLMAKTTHPDFLSSNIVEKAIIRKGLVFKQLHPVEAAPAAPYTGIGKPEQMLVDGRAGSTNLSDGHWLGFRTGFTLEGGWTKARRLHSVYVSTYIAQASWIFPPAEINVLGTLDGSTYQPLGKRALKDFPVLNSGKQTFEVPLKPGKWQKIRIVVDSWGPLPDDHPGKGNPAWLFIDEIILD